MIHKHLLGFLAVAILVASAAVTSVAQVGELRGHVWMQQADGQKVPLAGAAIDVFRTDVTAKYNTTTNKKGEFVFAGLPFIGTYTVAASHPTAQPNFVNGVKVGREIPCEITVTPGNGKRLTAEEVKSATPSNTGAGSPGGSSGGGGESAAEKAKREELIKKNKEIEEGNKKIEAANEVIGRTFKAGNEALSAASAAAKAKNSDEAVAKYTDAVTQYDLGLAADPEQPAILTNKAVALKGRGVERFNAAIRSSTQDDAARNAALQTAKDDFKAAAEAATKAVTLIKAQTVPTDPAEVARYNGNKYAAMLTNAEAMRLFVSKGDPTQAEAGRAAFKEYLAVETDPAKKARGQIDMAQMLLDSGAADKALEEFKAILSSQPDSPEANLGAGLALYATGDKAKYQDAANYLQHFVDVAPDTNAMKADAKAILLAMKETEKVTPEKTKPATRKRP
ncbi:MAG TPA: carboxypeptidase regulatory-like domain-containing protein [Pyrinomonadaceae bacterium]|jgi:tetratricopeptide (TPR) repeat protein|nr:carboxypeptidase regulatory-like domain-containing protein [Pyrinomonadaceae bacterium]